MMKKLLATSCLLLPLTAFAAESEEPAGPDTRIAQKAVFTYAGIVRHSYRESLDLTRKMDAAVDAFLAAPGEDTLQAAKDAWTAARVVYGQTETYRFYDGPIDGPEGPEGQINAWPMDEAYVDYVEGDPNAGIINNTTLYPKLDTDLIVGLNEEGGEANIATGYHAVEFLLWGQDLSADGPGNRSFKDYVVGSDAPNVERRRRYLAMVSDLLVEDLASVARQWAPVRGEYGRSFVSAPAIESLAKMWTGVVFMAADELSSERMFVAYDTRDQEDEHSCFSDTTHNDIVANAQGVLNVYYGTWGEFDGTGLHEVLMAVDAELAGRIDAQLQVAMAAVRAVPQPFDRVLSADEGSIERILLISAITELQAAGSLLQEGAAAMGITINL